MRAPRLTLLLLGLQACVCGTGTETRDYFCTATDQCVEGYRCDPITQTCVTGTAEDAGVDAGTDAEVDAGPDAGVEDAGLDAGTDAGTSLRTGERCSVASECKDGRCVDGRCCASACTGPCDFCDVPGEEGRCLTAPLGRSPVPACPGRYACNGVSTSCPSTCTTDAGCVGLHCGSGGVCIPKLSELKEDFNSGGFDASVWDSVCSVCTVVNQRFEVVALASSTNYPGISARQSYDLLDSELRIDLVDPGDQSLATHQAMAGGCDWATGNQCLQLMVGNGSVFIQLSDNNTYRAPFGYFPLDSMRSLRMREAAGTLHLEGQVDGGWKTLGSGPTPLRASFSEVSVYIGAGTYQAEATQSTVVWDNLNLP